MKLHPNADRSTAHPWLLLALAGALLSLLILTGCARGGVSSPLEVTLQFGSNSVPVAGGRANLRIDIEDAEEQLVALNVRCDDVDENILIGPVQPSREVCDTTFQVVEILYDGLDPVSARIRVVWDDGSEE